MPLQTDDYIKRIARDISADRDVVGRVLPQEEQFRGLGVNPFLGELPPEEELDQPPEPWTFPQQEPSPVSGRVTAPPTPMPTEPIQIDEIQRETARRAGETHYWSEAEKAWRLVEKPKEVPLSRIPFAEQIEPLGEVTPFKEIGEVMTSPEAEVTKQVLSFIGMVGSLVGIGFIGVGAIRSLTELRRLPEYKELLRIAKIKGIPKDSKVFQDAENSLRSAINLHRTGAKEAAQEVMSQYYQSYARAFPSVSKVKPQSTEAIIRSLVPRGTQTGALAFGGKRAPIPPEGIPSPVTPEVTKPVEGEYVRVTIKEEGKNE